MPRTSNRVYRRKDSPFFWAVYTDPQGHPVAKSTGCTDRKAADAWLAARQLERARADLGFVGATPVMLRDAAGEYLAAKEKKWSRGDQGWYVAVEGYFALRVIPHFGGDRIVSTITRAEVEDFRDAQIGTLVRGGTPVSNATVNRIMAALSAFGNWCLVAGREYHTVNPWAKHEALREDKRPPPRLDAEQIEAVLAALDGGRARFKLWRSVFELARETGLRKGELGRLRWEDVDLESRVAAVTSTREHGFSKSGEGRPVLLSPRAAEILAALPQRPDGYVFGPIPDPRKAFARGAKASGVERVWLHLFRHVWASETAEAGATGPELQALGGWSDARMVGRYTHARAQRLRDLADARRPGDTVATLAGVPKGTGDPESPNRP